MALSKCGRNPITSLRQSNGTKREVKKEGTVELDDGVIQVRKRNLSLTQKKEKELKRRNERPAPKDYPYPEPGSYSIDELVKLVRFHLRRPPRSRQSPDTTQSRYFCPYADCGYEGHADENAALNIGRRFLDSVEIKQKT